MSTLDGRVAIVTGAGQGVGRGIALALASRGARVVVADIDDDAATETVQIIEKEGGSATAVRTDVADDASVAAMCAGWRVSAATK